MCVWLSLGLTETVKLLLIAAVFMVLTFQEINGILTFQLPDYSMCPSSVVTCHSRAPDWHNPKTQETHVFSFASSQESACLESLQSLYLALFFFVMLHVKCASMILVLQPGIELMSHAWEAWSPNHWTAREVLILL